MFAFKHLSHTISTQMMLQEQNDSQNLQKKKQRKGTIVEVDSLNT